MIGVSGATSLESTLEPARRHGSGSRAVDNHPKSLWVREDKLLGLVRADLLAATHGDQTAIDTGTGRSGRS